MDIDSTNADITNLIQFSYMDQEEEFYRKLLCQSYSDILHYDGSEIYLY